jgi:NADH:ubiquinone oxidoreductase subunit E
MEDEINICSYDACEIMNVFLNDEKTHNKEFFEKELKTLNKELRKQKALLNSLNRIGKEYSYLEDALIQTRRNILERIYDLNFQIKETNKELKTT